MMHESYTKDTNLTLHFKYGELNKQMAPCQDFVVKNLREVALFLEFIRLRFRKPIIVTSGYRTPSYNKSIGGVPNSYHMLGKAVDITTRDPDDLLVLADKLYTSYLPIHKYIKVDTAKKYIHIQFGERDESVINLLEFAPFQNID